VKTLSAKVKQFRQVFVEKSAKRRKDAHKSIGHNYNAGRETKNKR
jgi:hypothetical protein